MAVIINPFFRGTTSKGITASLFDRLFDAALGTRRLRIYPSTVPYPGAQNIGNYVYPSTHLLDYSALNFSISGSSIILLSGTLAVNAVAAGTPSWWAFYLGNGNGIVSDSIGLTGSGKIVTLSSNNISVGQSVTINFSLASL